MPHPALEQPLKAIKTLSPEELVDKSPYSWHHSSYQHHRRLDDSYSPSLQLCHRQHTYGLECLNLGAECARFHVFLGQVVPGVTGIPTLTISCALSASSWRLWAETRWKTEHCPERRRVDCGGVFGFQVLYLPVCAKRVALASDISRLRDEAWGEGRQLSQTTHIWIGMPESWRRVRKIPRLFGASGPRSNRHSYSDMYLIRESDVISVFRGRIFLEHICSPFHSFCCSLYIHKTLPVGKASSISKCFKVSLQRMSRTVQVYFKGKVFPAQNAFIITISPYD